MIKCTDAIFTASSPSTFFHHLSTSKTQHQQRQISDSQIAQKLQLILISLREEAARANSYLQTQNHQLQQQLNRQTHLLVLVEKENALLTQFLEDHIQQLGQNNLNVQQIYQIKAAKEQLFQQTLIAAEQQALHAFQQRSPKKSPSLLSTNFVSNYHNEQTSESETRKSSMQTSSNNNFFSSSDGMHSLSSSISNFHKKSNPFGEVHIKQRTKLCHYTTESQISQISGVESKADPAATQTISEIDKADECDQLGLHSKGSNFFNHHQSSFNQDPFQDQNDQTVQKNSNTQIKANQNKEQNSLLDQYDDHLPQQSAFHPLKTEIDIKLMKQVLELNYGKGQNTNDNRPTNNQNHCLHQISLNENHVEQKQLKTLNHSYFKSLASYGKRGHENEEIVERQYKTGHDNKKQIESMRNDLRMVESKLRALFEPLPQSLISKKISLPTVKASLSNADRQSVDLERLNNLFRPLETMAPQSSMGNSDKRRRANVNKRLT